MPGGNERARRSDAFFALQQAQDSVNVALHALLVSDLKEGEESIIYQIRKLMKQAIHSLSM